MDYKDAGVDIEKTDAFVDTIKQMVKRTHNENVSSPIGGFAGLYRLNNQQHLVACTDGVGTKLMLAQQLKDHSTIGIDLVAMCVNDMLCVGANPLFFLDYYATGKFEPEESQQVMSGIVEGCSQSGIPLLGGETAEMPGMYPVGKYDLAGFAIGMVDEDKMIPSKKIQSGDVVIGVASSGFHSNGYSLVRQLVKDDEIELKKKLLTPTTIYTKYYAELRNSFDIKAIANITGGGLWNIPRISEEFDYDLNFLPEYDQIPSEIKTIAERSKATKEELYKTFNMGIGIALILPADQADSFIEKSSSFYDTWKLGTVKDGSGKVLF
jgi:phosphoribosylformylglycinamidine cyclo-ligase